MNSTMYIIPGPWPGRLAIVLRPRGGDWLADDAADWRRAGIDIVVSFLTVEEEDEFSLQNEAAILSNVGLEFVALSIPDRGVPESRANVFDLLHRLEKELAAGRTVALHCRQGIGRSGLIASGLLVVSGQDPERSIETVSAARGHTIPDTPEQRHWVIDLARHLESSRKSVAGLAGRV